MRSIIRYIVLLLALLVAAQELSAQNISSAYNYGGYDRAVGRSRSSMEMGVMVGASYMLTSADAVELTPQIGIRAALAMSLCWDEEFALQMELGYIHNKINAKIPNVSQAGQSVKNSVFEIPILFSYRGLGPVRLGIGPVLSLGGTARYDLPEERIEFGHLRPTLALGASVGVELSKHIVLDARYTSSFTSTNNFFEGVELSTKSHWLTFNLGYVF